MRFGHNGQSNVSRVDVLNDVIYHYEILQDQYETPCIITSLDASLPNHLVFYRFNPILIF